MIEIKQCKDLESNKIVDNILPTKITPAMTPPIV